LVSKIGTVVSLAKLGVQVRGDSIRALKKGAVGECAAQRAPRRSLVPDRVGFLTRYARLPGVIPRGDSSDTARRK
jgi:hypothetical protein